MDLFTFCTWHQHGIAWIEHFYNYSSTMYCFMDFSCFLDFSRTHLTFFDFFDVLVTWCPTKQKSKKAQKAQKSYKSQKSILLIS